MDFILSILPYLIAKHQEIEQGEQLINAASPAKPNTGGGELVTLRAELTKLERLPENEVTRFQLETQIAKLEREQVADEWPEFINA